MRSMFIALCALMFGLSVSGQEKEARAEFEKIRKFFMGPVLRHIAGQMLLKESGTAQVLDRVNFEYWIKDKKAFSKMNHIEVLNNGAVYVMVNHQRKTILARQIKGNTATALQAGFDINQIDKLIKTGVQIKLEEKEGLKKMTLSGFNDARFTSIILHYSSTDYHIIKVEASLKPEASGTQRVLEVSYQIIEQPAVSRELEVFASSRYIVSMKNSTMHFAKAYQHYTKL